MTGAEIRNYLKYVGLALAAFLVGCAPALVTQLIDPTMPDLNWRVVLGNGITALVAAYGGSLLPRSGSTGLASQVNELKDRGVPRSEMIVLSQEEAVSALAPDPVALIATMSADDLARVRDAAMARHQALAAQSAVRFP